MKRTSSKENTAIESKALTRAIERAQKGVEGKNFEIRKMSLNMMILLMNKEKLYIMKEIKF